MLQLTRTVYEAMIDHCRSQAPQEACGLLAGVGNTADHIHPMTNTAHSPVRYAMDPPEQLRVQRAMRSQGTTLLGIYHSHPASPAHPSPTDVALAADPTPHYLIVSLAPPRPVVQVFRIYDGHVAQDDLQVTG